MDQGKYGEKYVTTGETKEVDGHLVWRIKATQDFTSASYTRVFKNETGGWLEFPGHDHPSQVGARPNLPQSGNAWVGGVAVVLDRACVEGNARLSGECVMRDNALIGDNVVVGGKCTLQNHVSLSNDVYVYGKVTLKDYAQLSDRVSVEGEAVVSGTAQLNGYAHLSYDARVNSVTLYTGEVRRWARVERPGEVITVDGLFSDPVTVYRAANAAKHLVTAGCQTFQLDWDLAELAREHGWTLPVGWRSIRNGLLAVVRTWEPVETLMEVSEEV